MQVVTLSSLAPPNLFAGFKGPLRGWERDGKREGREGKGKKGKGREGREKSPPSKLISGRVVAMRQSMNELMNLLQTNTYVTAIYNYTNAIN